ncbi:MAG: GyrI-like domain-containing protein, partial [Ruminococcus sp.]|nr:GyrI-like domain-containing protein [Ruminococcus sp.]
LCVQCMHIGPYDSEPDTVRLMHEFMESEGYILDIGGERYHHEIYLSDPRKTVPEKLKTVIRHPIK